MLGETVGSYRITDTIGEGGMGAVYLAEHSLLGRTAAIKVLHPEFTHQAEIVERFFNEARSASAIRHPGIVEIFDFGYADDGAAYIVMEHLSGESLRDRLDNDLTLPPARAAGIARQLASALQAAHDQEIIHRDLKPDNVFLVPDQEVFSGERAKILDFGIAKLAAGKGSSFRTQTGQLFGSPAYMAPEQCRGAGRVDSRSDLYAVGCVLYEMVCGRPPFVAEGGGEVLAAHIYEAPEAPRALAPHIPEALESIILRLLEKDPDARIATAGALAAQLRQLGDVTGELSGPYEAPKAPEPSAPAVTPAPRASIDPKRTTLAAAASSTITRPPETLAPYRQRRLRVLAYAGGGAAAIALGVAALSVLGSSGTRAAEPDLAAGGAASAEARDSGPAAEPVVMELLPPDASTASAARAADAGPERVAIHIDSTPPGADVYALPEREHAGVTPLDLETPATEGTCRFAVARDGFRSATVELACDAGGERTVELERIERRRRRRRPRRDRSQGSRDQTDRAPDEDEPEPQGGDEGPLNPFAGDRSSDGDPLNPFER